MRNHPKLNLVNIEWMIQAYRNSHEPKQFFLDPGFRRHAGTTSLQLQIEKVQDLYKRMSNSMENKMNEFGIPVEELGFKIQRNISLSSKFKEISNIFLKSSQNRRLEVQLYPPQVNIFVSAR